MPKTLFKSHSMTETFNGITINEIYYVSGVSNEADALDASGIPRVGSFWGGGIPATRYYASGDTGIIICSSRKADQIPGVSGAKSPGFYVTVGWEPYERSEANEEKKSKSGGELVETGQSNLFQNEKAYDAAGNEIQITYQAPGDADGKVENFAAKIFLPRLTRTFSTIEESGTPVEKAKALVGYVDEDHQWMCVNYTWKENNNGDFDVSLTFSWDEDGWDPVVVFKNSDGKIPSDINLANLAGIAGIGVSINGAKRPKMYKEWVSLPYGITL